MSATQNASRLPCATTEAHGADVAIPQNFFRVMLFDTLRLPGTQCDALRHIGAATKRQSGAFPPSPVTHLCSA